MFERKKKIIFPGDFKQNLSQKCFTLSKAAELPGKFSLPLFLRI